MKLLGLCGQAGAGKNAVAKHLSEDGYREIAFADPVKEFAFRVFGFSANQLWGPSPLRNEEDTSFAERSRWNQVEDRLVTDGVSYLQETFNMPPRAIFSVYEWFLEFQRTHMSIGQGISPRIVLQSFGTAWGRAYDRNIWIKACFNEVLNETYVPDWEGPYSVKKPTIITDVRFENEMEAIKKVGGKIIRIERPGFDDKAPDLGLGNHESEMEQGGVIGKYADALVLNEGSLDYFFNQVSTVTDILFQSEKS